MTHDPNLIKNAHARKTRKTLDIDCNALLYNLQHHAFMGALPGSVLQCDSLGCGTVEKDCVPREAIPRGASKQPILPPQG
jgi:hypothetical protein